MITLRMAGIAKVLDGVTTTEEILASRCRLITARSTPCAATELPWSP